MTTQWHENKKRGYTHLHVIGKSPIKNSNIAYFYRMEKSANDLSEWIVSKIVPYLYNDQNSKRWIWLWAPLAGEKTDDFYGTKQEAYNFLKEKEKQINAHNSI